MVLLEQEYTNGESLVNVTNITEIDYIVGLDAIIYSDLLHFPDGNRIAKVIAVHPLSSKFSET
jgi:hypothetical protein